MKYKALFITAVLLAAPAFAVADDNQDGGPGMMPPPPPPSQSGEGRPGANVFFQAHFDGEGEHASSTARFEARPDMMMGTSTEDGRPFPPVILHFIASSTQHREGDRMMGTSTRPEQDREREHMNASTTEDVHASSTEDRGGPQGFFFGIFKRLFGGPHDNGNSSTTPPQMRGEQNGQGHEGDINASTTVNVEASSTPRTPPQAVIDFFQSFFSRFFH